MRRNYQKGGTSKYTSRVPYSRYKNKKVYKPSRAKALATGNREPTLVEQIANGAGQVAKLAQAVIPVIAAINTEYKYHDQTQTLTAHTPGTNDVIVGMTTNIAQGVTDVTRIGNSILAKNLQVRFAMDFPQTVGPPFVSGIYARMMIIMWKGNIQNDPPTAAKLFEAPTNLYSPVNKDYSEQMVVMRDKFFTMRGNGDGVATVTGHTSFKYNTKVDWHVRWQGPNTNDGTTDHIFLILRSSASGVTNALSTTYYSRLNYTDN